MADTRRPETRPAGPRPTPVPRRRFPADRAASLAGRLLAALVFLFLVAPLVVLVVSSFNPAASVAFPPHGFSTRWYEQVLGSRDWLVSFQLSGLLVLLVVPTVAVIGTLAAYGLARGSFPGRGALHALALSPLMAPEIITALGLLYYFQGIGLIDSVPALWLAHSLIALPYAVRAVMVSAAGLDPALERAAASLGASDVRVLLTVTLPLLRPGILAGALLAAVTSLGEVAVTALVAGAHTTTVPLRVFSSAQFELDPSVAAVSSLLMLASVVVMVVADRFAKISEVL
ncbi:ABC transporter permease [Actinomadura fibrosa]|uniref:ABC transporter permease n=1 Tax=Actinomadura fibrosa TaxID=111802 RepID=A0ABW2XWI6_9ACTN|nr:ABC transporter permease [Actinomadura fibrosa]